VRYLIAYEVKDSKRNHSQLYLALVSLVAYPGLPTAWVTARLPGASADTIGAIVRAQMISLDRPVVVSLDSG
jgi:hypothetical protein